MRKSDWVIAAVSALLCSNVALAQGPEWTLRSYWGGSGTEPGQFRDPRALAVGSNDNFYIADYGNGRVQQLDADGNFVRAWGRSGDAETPFNYLKSLTVDPDGNVHVLDGSGIEKFDADGSFLKATDPDLRVLGYSLASSGDNLVYTVGILGILGYNSDLEEVVNHAVSGCFEDSYAGIAAGDGQFYLSASSCQAVDVYSESGDRVGHWTSPSLLSSFSIAESKGRLFVTSPTERAVRIFTVDGLDVGSIVIPELPEGRVYPVAVATHEESVYVLAGDYLLKFSRQTAVEESTWTDMKEKYQ